jgi:mono/diheme cytochrome c family protein
MKSLLFLLLSYNAEAGPLSQNKLVAEYYNTAQPVFLKYCSSCHNADSAAPDWLNPSTAIKYRSTIYFRVFVNGDMPWRLKISPKDKKALENWLTMESSNESR